jgi:hypothetical protein
MRVTKLVGDCDDDDCPAVFTSDSGTLVFQGNAINAADGLRLGVGEQAVELPVELVREAVRVLGW